MLICQQQLVSTTPHTVCTVYIVYFQRSHLHLCLNRSGIQEMPLCIKHTVSHLMFYEVRGFRKVSNVSYIISFKSTDRSKAFSHRPAVVMRLHTRQILFTAMCKCISDHCLLLEKHSFDHDMSAMSHNFHLYLFVLCFPLTTHHMYRIYQQQQMHFVIIF